jgi:four helix bundle protein
MGDFTKLRVWQATRAFAVASYRITAGFPSDERFGLTGQVRRASVSIAANIAESTGRRQSPDQARLLRIAKGSVKEVRCELIIASDLGFLSVADQADAEQQLDQIDRMLSAMLRHLDPPSPLSRPPSEFPSPRSEVPRPQSEVSRPPSAVP